MEAREIMARRAPSLEERINALRDKGVVIGGTTYRYNFAQSSAATGVSRSMISMFANGNIRIKPEQQKILEDWVSDIERQAQEEAIETGAVEETLAPAPQTFKRNIELYQTHEFTEALGLLEWTRDNRKMCVMVGYPGIGKTTVIREFAKRVPDVHVIVCRSTMRMRDLLDSIAENIGVSASGRRAGAPHPARAGGEPRQDADFRRSGSPCAPCPAGKRSKRPSLWHWGWRIRRKRPPAVCALKRCSSMRASALWTRPP